MAYNAYQKLNDNIEAIRLALDWNKDTRLNATKIQALQKYSGFGGIKAVLYPPANKEEWIKLGATDNDLQLLPGITKLHELLQNHFDDKQYKEVLKSIKNSVLTAFYTPEIILKTLYRILKEQAINPERIYEPSSGSGIFLQEATAAYPEIKTITAVEKDILTGHILQALSSSWNVSAKVHITGFENTPVSDNGQYDLTISNIPFGNFPVYDEAYPDKKLSGKIHNYFFRKGIGQNY